MRISDEVKRLARAGVDKKIYAIYVLRKESGIDLVLAKEIVETIAAGGEVQLAAPSPEPQSAQTSEQRVRRQFEALRVAGRTGVVDPERIGQLLELLHGDEDLLGLINGTYCNRRGVLAASQNRLLFIAEDAATGPAVEEFLLESIYLVHHRAGVRNASINIFLCGGDTAEFTDVEDHLARHFATELKVRGDHRVGDFCRLSKWDQHDLVEAWHEQGTITNEEYVDWKRRLAGPRSIGHRPAGRSARRPS